MFKVLQLCCFTNFFPDKFHVENWDIVNGSNIFSMPIYYGTAFDLIIAAPPCTHFTKANTRYRLDNPVLDIAIAKRCLLICLSSRSNWVLENPPGRIEKFIPELTKFRVLTWKSSTTKKEEVVYSNCLITQTSRPRYCGKPFHDNAPKLKRLEFEPEFIRDIYSSIFPGLN